MTTGRDEHLYKIAADAQKLDKRPLLDRLREAAKTSHYSLYAEAYCALKAVEPEHKGQNPMTTDSTKDVRSICENCRFWDCSTQHRDAQPDTTGLCRKNTPLINEMTGHALWPFTGDTDWCGEFSASETCHD